MHVWNVLHAARWKYRTQKSPFWHHRTTLSGYIFGIWLALFLFLLCTLLLSFICLKIYCIPCRSVLCVICSVGVFKNGRVEIIANDQGNRITPSYVAFTPEGERLIGDAAKNQLTTNPENTVFDIKRLIGRRWEEPSVQSDIKFYPFTVVNHSNRPVVQVENRHWNFDVSYICI